MAEVNEPSRTGPPIPGEQWQFGDIVQPEELFRLLAIPPPPGYAPVAITAVGVVASPTGEFARYPVYAQLVGAELAEKTEVSTAIAIRQRWLRTQQQRNGPSGTTR